MASKIAERRGSLPPAEVQHLKRRIQELEAEVQNYKKRLDDLRKAKNQTILKREREILQVSSPFQRKMSESSIKEDKNSVDQASKEEIDKIKSAHAAELKELQNRISSLEMKDASCDHLEQIEQLTSALEQVENERDAQRFETRQLESRLKQVLNDLSLKEAAWCQREEELKKSLSLTFNARYQQWMRETESKIVDLQNANSQLRQLLEEHRPAGPDPTGQDKRF